MQPLGKIKLSNFNTLFFQCTVHIPVIQTKLHFNSFCCKFLQQTIINRDVRVSPIAWPVVFFTTNTVRCALPSAMTVRRWCLSMFETCHLNLLMSNQWHPDTHVDNWEGKGLAPIYPWLSARHGSVNMSECSNNFVQLQPPGYPHIRDLSCMSHRSTHFNNSILNLCLLFW